MAGLKGQRVCVSGNGQGDIATAILGLLVGEGVTFVGDDDVFLGQTEANEASADIAICTTGGMLIRDPAAVTAAEQKRLYEGNYLFPRAFTERHIAAMRRDQVPGLIVHLGSNAAWYGNVGAEDYAAYKSALRKYLELRGRQVRTDGIRICCLGFGGIASKFWDKATAGADAAWSASIVPGARTPLTVDEAAEVVLAVLQMPARVVVRDALIVAVDYQ